MTEHSIALDQPLERLYDLAIHGQWDVDRDIEWNTLNFAQVAPLIRESMQAIYSHVLHAEQRGLRLCFQLAEKAPEGCFRDLARIQVVDEIRHVEFFSRVVSLLGGCLPAGPSLILLEQELADLDDCFDLFVHAQIAELAAQSIFLDSVHRSERLMAAAMRIPGSAEISRLLRHLKELVSADESRHIAYGMQYLKSRKDSISAKERTTILSRASLWCELYDGAFGELHAQGSRLGLNMSEVLRRTRRSQQRQLLRVGLELGS